jgi:hypothetical protein
MRPASLAALALLLPPPAHADEPAGLRAGAFAQDITPQKLPISLNGGMQDRMVSVVNDKLHARCLVLDDGKTALALIVCDCCMIPREVVDEAKRRASKATGIPVERILISATHTHSAPTVAGVFQSDPDREYVAFLTQRIADGVVQAHKNLVPARAGWGVGRDEKQVFNRRWKMRPENIAADPFGRLTDRVKMNPGYQAPGLVEPAGPTDPEVVVLSVQTREGKPLALLANYGLHYVGGYPGVSADYFGACAERIGSLLEGGPGFVGIMSNGTSGDVNNIDFAGPAPGKREPGEQIRLVADSVARAAFAAYKKIDHRADVTLAMAEKEIELGVRLPSAEDVKRAEEILAKAPTPLKTLSEVYARETVLLAKYPPKVTVKVQAIRVGAGGIVSSPCETFAEIGLDLKKRSPLKPTCVIELANGYNGYLPTPEQHKLGGYETWRARSSYVEEGAAPKLTAAWMELLAKVKE